MMGVFNNLLMFDQHAEQNSLQSIVPDLAKSWSWNEEGTTLTFVLRDGVKWHDSKPFTARDVQCTWDMIAGKLGEKFRVNPRKSWYRNLGAGTKGRVRDGAVEHSAPDACEPRQAAIRQPGFAAGDVADPRPQSVHRHPRRRRGYDRRRDDAAAGRSLGTAARGAAHFARVR